jgi:tetratricopeptide (TPR) repeat protein
MTFLSLFIRPSRKGERNFERGRAAEQRGDIIAAKTFFRQGAEAYDKHLTSQAAKGEAVRPSHLIRAGICYVRSGRDRDGLTALEAALAERDIPDAFLHAGYAAARLGNREAALAHWTNYPDWAGQPIIASALAEQIAALRRGDNLDKASEAVVEAIYAQDRDNARIRPTVRHSRPVPPHRGY